MLMLVAVRLLQLQELAYPSLPHPSLPTAQWPNVPCDEVLSETEWTVLYATTTHQSRPYEPPSAQWVYRTIAKPGGWADKQRSGRPGWEAIWLGLFRLAERVEGYVIAAKQRTECNR